MNNATLFTAGRTTHVKILAVALVASVAVIFIAGGVRVIPENSTSHVRAVSHSVVAGR
jgi:hypothetical protein